MLKKIIITLGIVIAITIATTGAFLFFHQEEPEIEKQKTNHLESYEKSMQKEIENRVLDESEKLSEKEISVIQEEVIACLDKYYGTMFNINAETSDYTNTLKGYFGTGDLFIHGNANIADNIYAILQAIHMDSEYQDYQIKQMIIRKDTKNPEVHISGTVQASFQNDQLKQGEYSVLSNIILVKEGEMWKVFRDNVSTVYGKNQVTASVSPEEKTSPTVQYKGEILGSFDFKSPKDYTDASEDDFDWEQIKEPGLTILE